MMNLSTRIRDYLVPLYIRRVRFHCTAEKALDVQIPQLRGTWGLAINQVDKHLYSILFEGISPLSPLGQKNPKYIIRPNLQCFCEKKNKTFSFEFLTWNITDEQYKTLLTAWNIVSMCGLGKERIRFKIENAEPLHAPFQLTNIHTLTFPHSVRLMKKGQLITEPTFYDVVLAILYRLAPIVAAVNGSNPSSNPKDDWIPEYQEILDVAKTVQSVWLGETKIALHHYSTRQKRDVNQTGVSGLMHVSDFPEELLPLLFVAADIHIGKATIMGLGRVMLRQ